MKDAGVFFVGAGPGDPDLITVAGRRLIGRADLVLYAGSLVPAALVACAKKGALVMDSSGLTLEECHWLTCRTALAGGLVARVHTGDPSIYGALAEQGRLLDEAGVDWRVIPGVTAACAAAAAARISLTLPEIRQCLAITRLEGETPMPPGEDLALLARCAGALAIYLSGRKIGELRRRLLESLPPQTPVLCAHALGWPDEKMIRTTVAGLESLENEPELWRQTLFLILPGEGKDSRSRLYDGGFSHMFRKGG